MKRIKINSIYTTVVSLIVAFNVALFAVGCEEEFDDETMALLKKPEVLSVVLDPPEAAPGETVTATFLIADGKGVRNEMTTLWMPLLPEAVYADPAAMNEVMTQMGLLDPNAMTGATFEFTVPDAKYFSFDESGKSGLPIMFSTAISGAISADLSIDELANAMEQAVVDGAAKQVMRTLVVSNGDSLNDNPEVISLFVQRGDSLQPIHFAAVSDADLESRRQNAANNPVVVVEGAEVNFLVNVSDDGDVAADIRYQWISTGGDFGGIRAQLQPFEAPEYKALSAGEMDFTNQTNVNPRLDPNLHTVWIIVRDNEVAGQLGQTFAEFYVRVVPNE